MSSALRPSVMARLFAAALGVPYASRSAGPFRVVVADPPWRFNDALPGATRGASKNYDDLSIEDICTCRFDGGHHIMNDVADDAYLFLWRVSAGDGIDDLTMTEQAYGVARAWEFAPKTELVWRKQTKNGKRHFGMGWHLRNEHETCVVAVRGRPKPLVRNIRSVFDAVAPSGGNGRAIHSAKPSAFFAMYPEKMSRGPYLELFARQRRTGWVQYGREL